jgi:hypothetical protein
MFDNQIMQVCFLTQDTGLAEAVARALGNEFETRVSMELQFEKLKNNLMWSHALLIDLRSNVL